MREKIEKKFRELEVRREALFARLDQHKEERLNEKPNENRWSVVQVLNHLILSERSGLEYMKKKLSYNPDLKKANWQTVLRTNFLKVALRLPFKYKAPAVVAEVSNEEAYEQVKAKWEKVREDWKDFIDTLSDEQIRAELFKHPFAGKMNILQALDFIREHYDHHMKQVERIRKSLKM